MYMYVLQRVVNSACNYEFVPAYASVYIRLTFNRTTEFIDFKLFKINPI